MKISEKLLSINFKFLVRLKKYNYRKEKAIIESGNIREIGLMSIK